MDQKFEKFTSESASYENELRNELNKEFESNESRGFQALRNYMLWSSVAVALMAVGIKLRYAKSRIQEINLTGGYTNVSGAKVCKARAHTRYIRAISGVF